MIIEKNGTIYTVCECDGKWTVQKDGGKLSVSFNVSKNLCETADELREYVQTNDVF